MSEDTKTCKDCGADVPELECFPGPRCLNCHAKWFDSIPLARHGKPDFAGCVNLSGAPVTPKFRRTYRKALKQVRTFGY